MCNWWQTTFGRSLRRFFWRGWASSAPLKFNLVLNSHQGLILKDTSTTIAASDANSEYQKQFDSDTLPVAPVYAARLPFSRPSTLPTSPSKAPSRGSRPTFFSRFFDISRRLSEGKKLQWGDPRDTGGCGRNRALRIWLRSQAGDQADACEWLRG